MPSSGDVVHTLSIDAAYGGAGAVTLDWVADTIYALLVKATYVPLASHDYLDDVPSGDRIGSAVVVSGKTFANAVAGCADPVFTSVADGDAAARVVFYKSGATDAARLLICTRSSWKNGPLQTNGADITAEVPAAGLFRFAP